MTPTEVYDTYWRFAAERHAVFERRLVDPIGPWTADAILSKYRFTNVFRAVDRVSQRLIADVQYGEGRSQAPVEVFFRTMLFKLFNKIETWELLERSLGPISWHTTDLDRIERVLASAFQRGQRIYSAAYIMPSPNFGHERKHANHLALLGRMISDGLHSRIQRARSLREVYDHIVKYEGIGPFLAYQYAIDLNYSTLTDFDENDFVVPGPGALDGLSKCFDGLSPKAAVTAIEYMVDAQDREFASRGIEFHGLFGRKMHLIDAQNVFCEISKYARVAHPGIPGVSGRQRIKQSFRAALSPVATLVFPPQWGLRLDSTGSDLACRAKAVPIGEGQQMRLI